MNAGRSASRNASSRGARLRIVDPPAQQVRAEPHAGEPLVQVLARPGGEPGVDGLVEGDELLRDPAAST